jgi:hypothetical protein
MAKASDNQFPKIIITEGSAPSNATSGDQKLYLDSSDHHLKRKNSSGTVVDIEAGGSATLNDYINIQDQKTKGTDGGTFTTGAWRTRDLNTEQSDTGGHASVASNQITLASGTYICRIIAPAFSVNEHVAKLYNITDTADVLIGTSAYARQSTGLGFSHSIISGKFTISGSKVLEVQHISANTISTNGFGTQTNLAAETYTVAEFWKVA